MHAFVRLSLLSLLLGLLIPSRAVAEPLLSDSERATAAELIERGLGDELAWAIVESLTTEVGPRPAGTAAEARARDWALTLLSELGFSNARVETFETSLWQRGLEQAEIVSPFPQPLVVTALGGSAGTGLEGIAGPVVSFRTLAELQAAPSGSRDGAVVFVDEVMSRTQDGSGYGVAVAKRYLAASEAKRLGASAVLIRSVGTSQHRFAHTGQMKAVIHGEEDTSHVPAAALSAPDADQLRRALARSDEVVVRLVLTPEVLPAAQSGNVIAEIPGRESPEELVLVGAHLDSWDLGTGAIDDGAGVGIVVAAARLVRDLLPEGPRRTIRIVLFGAEEVGLIGARAYVEQHREELANHVMASESDFGSGRVWRFDTNVGEGSKALADAIGAELRVLGIGPGREGASGGPDIGPMQDAVDVPVLRLYQDGTDYFDVHHTPNDTLDKIDRDALRQNVAAWAAMMYLVAETPERLAN
ncbi:MAG: M20/M25/M40 family metallo-hydrolase [Pseudomonadota bacterium]